MADHIPLLSSLIEQSKTCAPDDSEDILYQFVSAHHRPYDITGCENEALALLVNFSVKRTAVHNPLSLGSASNQLEEKNCRLVERYYQSVKGIHTHNIKFPLSFLRGNIRHEYTFDPDDPYVHPGSVKPSKRWGYSQNAAYIKAAKALFSEFYFEGKLTSLFEEVRSHSGLGKRFISLLTDAVDNNWEAKNEEDERPDELVESSILNMAMNTYPDFATDPQIHSHLANSNEGSILLSPIVNTSLQRELYIRLQDSPPWMKAGCFVGTDLDKNTYGDLISDTGGFLRVFRSIPPREVKSKYRLLLERLGTIGHLYRFDQVSPDFLMFFTNIADTETGQLKRTTTYRQNQIIKKELRLLARSIFRDYKYLYSCMKNGKRIKGRDESFPQYSRAQAYLLTRNTRRSEAFKAIKNELMPILEAKIEPLAVEAGLPFTVHHRQGLTDAIGEYLCEL